MTNELECEKKTTTTTEERFNASEREREKKKENKSFILNSIHDTIDVLKLKRKRENSFEMTTK